MNTAKPLTRLTFSCARRSRVEHGLPILRDISAQSHAHSSAEACKSDVKWGHVHTPPLKSLGKSTAHAQRRPTCTEKAKPRQRVARILEWPFILHSPTRAKLLRNQRRLSFAQKSYFALIGAMGGPHISFLKTMSAREAKNCFGLMIDMARAAPVLIEKHGRGVVVVMAVEEYERLTASSIAAQPCATDGKIT